MAVDVLVVVAVRQAAELLAEALAAGVVLASGAIAVAAPVAHGPCGPGKLFIVGDHHAALAGRDVVGRIERGRRKVAEGPREAVAVARTEGIAVVLDEPEVVLFNQIHDRVEVEGHPQRVRQHDRSRTRRDRRAQLVGIGVVVAQPDVDEHWHQAVLDDRGDGAGKGRGHGDHLVAGLEPAVAELRRGECGQGHEIRGGTGVDEEGVREAEIVGEARFELLRVPTGRQVEVEAGVDQVAHLRLPEDAACIAHGIARGIERLGRVAFAVVPAH